MNGDRGDSAPSRRTLAVLQPGYLPWLGFFDQMRRADVFVYYDDVQYDKGSWRNRNRIKTKTGPQWLTVPVHHGGFPRIVDVEIDRRSPWVRKHISSLQQAYAGAPYTSRLLPDLEAVLSHPWERLVDLDLAVVDLLRRWLGISTQIERSSTLGVAGDRSGRLVALCHAFHATTYLSGNAASDYLDAALFEREGIAVEWQDFVHPTYPQLHGTFVPYLSAVDVIFNCGDEAAAVLDGRASPLRTYEAGQSA